jgi:hypothetical protein
MPQDIRAFAALVEARCVHYRPVGEKTPPVARAWVIRTTRTNGQTPNDGDISPQSTRLLHETCGGKCSRTSTVLGGKSAGGRSTWGRNCAGAGSARHGPRSDRWIGPSPPMAGRSRPPFNFSGEIRAQHGHAGKRGCLVDGCGELESSRIVSGSASVPLERWNGRRSPGRDLRCAISSVERAEECDAAAFVNGGVRSEPLRPRGSRSDGDGVEHAQSVSRNCEAIVAATKGRRYGPLERRSSRR